MLLPVSAFRRALFAIRPASLSFRAPVFVPALRLLRTSSLRPAMDLSECVRRWESWADPRLAESWDNVGLLIEPSAPKRVETILLTNDLTEAVMAEALREKADLILSYHPPIFRPIKRIQAKSWKERLVAQCLENRVALYSPHTVLDNLEGGVNDWLIKGAGEAAAVRVLGQGSSPSHQDGFTHTVVIDCPPPLDTQIQTLLAVSAVRIRVRDSAVAPGVEIDCAEDKLPDIVEAVSGLEGAEMRVMKLECHVVPRQGIGRMATLREPVSLQAMVDRIKAHVGVEHLRVGVAAGKTLADPVSSVASCAGSGASVLAKCRADVWLTGELSHHEALDAVQNGTSVILCEHSNSERGYLKVLADKLDGMYEKSVRIVVSAEDRDPLLVV